MLPKVCAWITVITFTQIYWILPIHSNVTIKNVSWPHFSWPTLYAWTWTCNAREWIETVVWRGGHDERWHVARRLIDVVQTLRYVSHVTAAGARLLDNDDATERSLIIIIVITVMMTMTSTTMHKKELVQFSSLLHQRRFRLLVTAVVRFQSLLYK